MHKPSGLGIYGLWQEEIGDGSAFAPYPENFDRLASRTPTVWYLKPFWRKTWSPDRRNHSLWRVWPV